MRLDGMLDDGGDGEEEHHENEDEEDAFVRPTISRALTKGLKTRE